MPQLSADTDDEGEEYMSSLFSRTPLIMRKMLGSVHVIFSLYNLPSPTHMAHNTVPPLFQHLRTSLNPQHLQRTGERTIRATRSNLWHSPTLDWPRSPSPHSLKGEGLEGRTAGTTGLECSENGVSKWTALIQTTLMMVSRLYMTLYVPSNIASPFFQFFHQIVIAMRFL